MNLNKTLIISLIILLGVGCVKSYDKFEQLSLKDKKSVSSGSIDSYCSLKATDTMSHFVKCEVKKSGKIIYSRRSAKFSTTLLEIQKQYCNPMDSSLIVSCIPDPSPVACSEMSLCTMEFDPHVCRIKKSERQKWNMPDIEGKGGNRCVAYQDLIKKICGFNQDPEKIREDKVICERSED